MKIHERVKRGKKVWTVDGRINGKRQRSNFETKRAAEAYLKIINKEPELSAWWAGLSLADRFDLKANLDQLAKSLKAKSVDENKPETPPKADPYKAIHNRRPRSQNFATSWKT